MSDSQGLYRVVDNLDPEMRELFCSLGDLSANDRLDLLFRLFPPPHKHNDGQEPTEETTWTS